MKNPMKMLLIVTFMFGLVLGIAACENEIDKKKMTKPKTTGCAALFDKIHTCTKELGEENSIGKAFLKEGKDKFVDECKKDFDSAKKLVKCVDKASCNDFFKCAFGVDLAEMKRAADAAKK